MVSVERYVNAYRNGILSRQKDLWKAYKLKRRITSDLAKKQIMTPLQREQLMVLIGKDHFFKIGEKVKTRSLRHLLWKTKTGFEGILNNEAWLKKNIIKKCDNFFKNQYTDLLNLAVPNAEHNIKKINEMDKLLIKEEKALVKDNLEKYLEFSSQEHKLIRIVDKMQTNRSLKYIKKTKYIISNILNERKDYVPYNDGSGSSALGSSLVAGVAMILVMSFFVGPQFSSWFEDPGVFMKWTVIVGLSPAMLVTLYKMKGATEYTVKGLKKVFANQEQEL